MQYLFGGNQDRAGHLRREMRGRNEIDVVTAARLQVEHHLSQTLMRYLVFDLFFVGLRNLIILAIDATQIAVSEKDVARAACAHQRRLFTKVRGVRGNDRQATGITSGDLIIQSIVEAIARTDSAALEQSLERFDTTTQFA